MSGTAAPSKKICVRFLNKDAVNVDRYSEGSTLTVAGLKVLVARACFRFAPEIGLFCYATGKVLDNDGDKEIPSTVVALQYPLDYDKALWKRVFRSHALAEDKEGILTAMSLLESADAHTWLREVFLEELCSYPDDISMGTRCIETLLRVGKEANIVEAENERGRTGLSLAASYWTSGMITLLLQAGSHVNQADVTGWTPMHWATVFGRTDIINSLLHAGADAFMRTTNTECFGLSCMEMSFSPRLTNITELFLPHDIGEQSDSVESVDSESSSSQ